jgi:hypothetical protein
MHPWPIWPARPKLMFSVPRGTRPKALVFTQLTYDDVLHPERGTDVRISLAE